MDNLYVCGDFFICQGLSLEEGRPQSCVSKHSEGHYFACRLQFYETGLVDKKLWPFGEDLRRRFEQTKVRAHDVVTLQSHPQLFSDMAPASQAALACCQDGTNMCMPYLSMHA